MKTGFETIITEIINNHILLITFNRPKFAIAFNTMMSKELTTLIEDLSMSSDNIRSIILTGSGQKAFCSGGDLKSFHEQGDNVSRHLKEVTHFLHGAITRFSRMNAPLIVSVNGVAAGALSLIHI